MAFATAALLTGCGVIYTSPQVSDRPTFGSAYETNYEIRVVPLTYETAAAANLEPYVPARLPAAFQPDAARAISAGSASLPDLPPLPPRTARETLRPEAITENLPPPGKPEAYRIGVGDVVLLAVSQQATSVEGLPGLIAAQSKRTGYTVQDDGAIAVPDAGRIEIAGKTVRDAERDIFRALVAAGIDPSFSLEVAEFHSQVVSVGGLVGSPTLVPITLKPLQLQAAIEIAGGITADDPSVAEIQIFRDGTRYQVALSRYLGDPDLRRMVLRDGDSIYVGSRYREAEAQRYFQEQLTLRNELMSMNELRQQRADEAASLAASLLAEDRALFEQRLRLGSIEQPYAFVAGEVGTTIQVPLPFERTMSLANLLFNEAVGGITIRTADYGAIYLLRPETDPQRAGGLTAYHLDAENVANLAAASTFQIHANDILFIAEQPVTSWNRALSQILPDLLSIYGLTGSS